MKKPAVIIIEFYQLFISRLAMLFFGAGAVCRFSPTCSQFTKTSISKYGVIKGTIMGASRLLSCQPLFKL